ncbi:MAG TPA: hypothetical protein VFA51_11595 [Candidatus Udaeobacter sp.]|nr:hypothetical protein [Candidatus Udaeobacter sp.]
MKNPLIPRVSAHLIRGAFYVLLRLALGVIRLALKLPNKIKRSVAWQNQSAQHIQAIAPSKLSRQSIAGNA